MVEIVKELPEWFKEFIIENEDERIIAGWASVETVDKQGDVVPISELAKAMLKFMDRGGIIVFGHENKPVGKVLHWEIKKDPRTGKYGVWIVAKINRGYEIDNKVWELIKQGVLKGFSIGGFGEANKAVIKDDNGVQREVNLLKNLQIMEISIVSEPANPYAVIEAFNEYAKGEVQEGGEMEKADKSRYVDESGRFKVMTCPDDPSKKSRFCGCVRYMMSQGYDLESAKRICGYIRHYVKKAAEEEGIADILAEAMFGKNVEELSDEERTKVHEVAVKIRRKIMRQLGFDEDIEKQDVQQQISQIDEQIRELEERKRKLQEQANQQMQQATVPSGTYPRQQYIQGGQGFEETRIDGDKGIVELEKIIKALVEIIKSYNDLTKELAKELVEVQKPFAGFKNFDDCVKKMKERGYDDESAHRICGYLYWKYERGRKNVGSKSKKKGITQEDIEKIKKMVDELKKVVGAVSTALGQAYHNPVYGAEKKRKKR